ncbi:GPP34 family phosphoprotein [Geodermatophilus sp. SYSU D00815]
MDDGQLSGGVAARVAALCLDRRGRVADWAICGPAVRAGLLLDLALAGRLEHTPDSVVVDGTPTGFPPADRLLAAIGVEPERSLDDWLDERRIGLRDLVAAGEASGRWHRRRLRLRRDRYEAPGRDDDLARDPGRPGEGWAPQDACVTAVAAASGLLDRDRGLAVEPPAPLVAAAGPAAWLCQAVCEHLVRTAARYRAQAGALRRADTVGPG